MQIWKARPLCCFCWLFSLMVAYYVCHSPQNEVLRLLAVIFSALLGAILLLCLFFRRVRFSCLYAAFLSLALLLGTLASLGHACWVISPAHAMTSGRDQTTVLHGTVVSVEVDTSYFCAYGVRANVPDAQGPEREQTMVYLNVEGGCSLRVGDEFHMEVALLDVEEADEQAWRIRNMRSDGYCLVGYADQDSDYTVLKRDQFIFKEHLDGVQQGLSWRLSEAIGGQGGKLVAALLLGTREELSNKLTLDFRRAGASHFLALSGLHLSLIVMMLGALLKLMRCPFRIRLLVLSAFAVLFMVLTGCSASMVRATVMLLWLNVSRLLGDPNDSLTPLSCFFAASLAIQPACIYDVGLWLTCLATFAIIEIVPALFGNGKKPRKDATKRRAWMPMRIVWKFIFLPLLSSCVVLLVLALPMALSFGEISLLSPVANLVLGPLTTLLLGGGLLLLPLLYLTRLPLISVIVQYLSRVLAFIANAMIRAVERMSDVQGALISLKYDFVKPLLAVLIALFLIFLLFKWKHPRLFLLVLLLWVAVFFACLNGVRAQGLDGWHSTYTIEGKGEVLCLTQNEQTILCDATDGSYTAYRSLFEEGLPLGTTEIEALVLTHYHKRHISTVRKILENYRVRTIYLPRTFDLVEEEKAEQDRGVAGSIAALARECRTQIRYYLPSEGAQITPGLSLDRLYYAMIKRSTHPTVSVCWSYGAAAEQSPNRSMIWLGASAWESGLWSEILDEMYSSPVWILGGHGPIIKRDYEIADEENADFPELIVCAGEAALEALSPEEHGLEDVECFFEGNYAFDLP